MMRKPRLGQILSGSYSGVKVFNDLMAFFNNALAIAGNVGAGVVTIFAIAGTTSSGRASGPLLDVANMQFALRFVILVVIAAAMGWALGALVSWLTADQSSDGKLVIGYLVAAVTGGLLIFSADWLSLDRRGGGLPELEVLTGIGLAVALWVASFQFRLHAGVGVRGVIKARSNALTVFAFACILILGLTMAGNA